MAQQGAPRRMTFVHGACSILIAAGRDMSADCHDTVMVSTYTNGRINLAFTLTDSRGVIGFSGTEGRQTTRDGTISQPIDHVVMVGPGGPAQTLGVPGQGLCKWRDLAAGATTISCEMQADEGGAYRSVFATDGAAPGVQDF